MSEREPPGKKAHVGPEEFKIAELVKEALWDTDVRRIVIEPEKVTVYTKKPLIEQKSEGENK